jgi:CrcB protein
VNPAEAIAEAELAHAPEDLPAARPPGPGERWRARLTPAAPCAALSAGAILGANARYLVGVWAVAHWGSAFPWGTFVINVTGSLLLGFYLTLVTERFAGRATTRLFVATGFCGAYTTFSTFSYEAVTLVQRGAIVAALAYVLGSLAVGLLAVRVGILAARAL